MNSKKAKGLKKFAKKIVENSKKTSLDVEVIYSKMKKAYKEKGKK